MPYTGQVELFAFNFAPRNWAECQGQVMQMQTNMPLFSLLGTTYGGDGVRTFNLPNLPPVGKNGPRYFICLYGDFPSRD
jgi:microcystin-dependent protein